MQELSDAVRRFQQIKAREKKVAIEKTQIKATNPTLSQQQVNEIWKRSHEVKRIVVKSNHGKNHTVVVEKV